MTRAKRTAIVAALNQRLRQHGSWSGETHMQKAVYFLQELLRVRTDFDFVLYKHGPFSFDLRDVIGQMRAERLLEFRQQPYPYGPSLVVPAQQEEVLRRRFPNTLRRYADRLEFVASELGRRRVSELERLSTALYVTRQDSSASDNAKARQIVELKPHISYDDALSALRAVADLEQRAEPLRRQRDSTAMQPR